MTGNRVEELEQTVAELQATVSGLTDELVETKERLRLVEDHFGPELDDIIEGTGTRSDGAADTSPPAEPSTETGIVDADGASDEPEAESADGSKPEEAEADDEPSGSGDIIVA